MEMTELEYAFNIWLADTKKELTLEVAENLSPEDWKLLKYEFIKKHGKDLQQEIYDHSKGIKRKY